MRIIAVLLFAGALLPAAEKFGKELTLKSPTPVATLLDSPEKFVGKTVQVKGKVTEVCEMMGCWMQIAEAERSIRIKVKDGEIMFPKTAPGRTAVAEGVLKKIEMTQKQAVAWAKHEAEERGQKFDESKIKSGKTMYQIDGSGAVLLD